MPVNIVLDQKNLIAYLSGDIDHHTAPALRESIDSAIEKNQPSVLKLDFKDVSFMDSSGVGLVMGRYKAAKMFGGVTQVLNLPDFAYKVMRLSGLEKIINFYKENGYENY